MDKPSIGAVPYYIQAGQRIAQLGEAICAYSQEDRPDIIKKWAKEIILQCELIEKMGIPKRAGE